MVTGKWAILSPLQTLFFVPGPVGDSRVTGLLEQKQQHHILKSRITG